MTKWLCLCSLIAALVAGCTNDAINVGGLDLASVDERILFIDDLPAPPDMASSRPPPDMAFLPPSLTCESGGIDGGADPCISGRGVEYPPSCLQPLGMFVDNVRFLGTYEGALARLRMPGICASFPNGGTVGMARAGVCGDHRFIETQGLGLGVIIHRFYDAKGYLVGAQTRDDIAGNCWKSYGEIPNCALIQCELICYDKSWIC